MTDHVLRVTLDPQFSRLLQRQDDLQAIRLGQRVSNMTDSERQVYIRDMTLAGIVEMTELLDETHWKPWATRPEGDPIIPSPTRYLGEMADVLIFIMNLMLAGGISMTDLAKAAEAKQEKNLKRWTNGYDGKSGKCLGCKRSYDDEGVNCYPSAEESGMLAFCTEQEAFLDRTGTRV